MTDGLRRHSVNVNGGQLLFDVTVRDTVAGTIGVVYVGGVEVFTTKPASSREAAYERGHRDVLRAFARVAGR